MRHLFTVLFLLIGCTTNFLFAQLSGTVFDEDGNPLPYASVYVRNSTNGTAANGNGEYKLLLDRGEHEIVFQYIGYKQHIEKVTISGKPLRLNVRMEPSDLQLSEVVITTEDPAYGIMRNAIERRPYYKNQIREYACDAYIKGFYKLADAPKKILGQDVGNMGGILDSTRAGVIYLSESVSKLYVQAKPPRQKEVMISSKVSGSQDGFSLNRATLTDFSLYDERINIDRDILSPLADNAFSYYRFRLLGRYRDENGYFIYKIEVTPKRDEDPTFMGHLYIVDELWNLAGVDLQLTGKAIQQPVLDTMRIQQEFVPVAKPDTWRLLSQFTGFKFAVLGFKVNGFFNGIFSNYNLNPGFKPDFFTAETFKIDKEATTRDTAYWSSIRPIPLTGEEARDYVRKDSLEKIWESKDFLDSMDRKNNRFKPMDLVFGYSWRNSHKRLSIGYPSLLDGVQFNTVQGWLLHFNPTFNKSSDKRNTRYWKAEGNLNYGFSEKRLRGGLRLERRFESVQYTRAALAGGVITEQFDAGEQITELINGLYSLFDRKNYLKLYEKAYARAEFGRHIANGLRLDLGAEYAERRPLINHSNFSYYRKDRPYAPNAPLPLPATEPEQPFFNTHQAFVLDASLRIRFGETYSTYGDRRIREGSDWPEITLRYRKAMPAFGAEADYDFAQVSVQQSSLPMGLFGYTEWNLSGGVFWRHKYLEFMDFYHPKGNRTFLGQPRRYAQGFFLLPYYEFSTADAYAEGHIRHHFNGWLLDKVPLLRKLNWKEALGVSAYFADTYAWKEQRPGTTLPYWELIFGFYNIGIKFFRPLHVDVAVGFLGEQHYRTGVVLGLDL